MRDIKPFRIATAAVLAFGLSACSSTTAPAAGDSSFAARTDDGRVYVNAQLAERRLDAAFIPLVVGIVNRDDDSVTFDRSSFALRTADGTTIPLADVGDVYDRYGMLDEDVRILRQHESARILPIHGLRETPSRFFPNNRGLDPFGAAPEEASTVISEVQLLEGYWTRDVLYFARPAGLGAGDTATLVVDGDGWEKPVEVAVRF